MEQHKGYTKEAAATVRDWAFDNTDYPTLYSYCKYTNVGSYKTAEFTLPGCELVKNKGFNDENIRQLKDYIDNEQDTIFAMAKQVNPFKAMMGAKIE